MIRILLVALALPLISAQPVPAQVAEFVAPAGTTIAMCPARGPRTTCLVDGDTIWVEGVKFRLAGFDTPEPTNDLCGGDAERALAARASARLLELLNSGTWTLRPTGAIGGRGRDLAALYAQGRDVGAILVAERLARWWPDGDEWWCS